MSFFKKKSFESVQEAGKTGGLSRTLTAFDLILLGLGSIVGTGVFTLTGLVASQYAGPAVTISYILAGFTCIFVALAYTELATMLPTSGSVYTYSYVAFGEVFAWIVGGILIIELGFASSSVAGSWSAYMQAIFVSAGITLPEALTKSPFNGGIVDLPAVLISLFVGFMLYRGTKESKVLNTALVFIKMLTLFLFVVFSVAHFDLDNWESFMPYGFDDVLFGTSLLFFAFTGFATLATTAEECKNPERDLRIGIIGSLICVTLVYVFIAAILTGSVPFSELNTPSSLAYALKKHGNNIASGLLAAGAVAGMTSVIMINIYAQSRIFYVISRDGLLHKNLSKIHYKYDSPYIAIFMFTIMVALMGGFIPYDVLAKLSSMAALTDYIIVAVIVMIFRITKPTIERSFKCPLVFFVAPFAAIASTYLLFKQVIDKNNELLFTGKFFIGWIIVMFILYVIRISFFKKREV